MLDQLEWLGKKEELEFRKIKFTGKDAGKSWQYAQSIDGLIITRAIVFAMAALVFYPILSNYLFHDVFTMDLLVERVIFSLMLIVGGVLFNRNRVIAIIIASVPIGLILLTYLFFQDQMHIYKIGFTAAVLFLVLRGLHYNKRSKKLKQELDSVLLENQLIDD